MLVLVVGPSGAGKDTLINAARFALAGDARFVFPRRIVTRDAVIALEDHETITPAAFAAEKRNGAFALSWEAHGLHYGLPESLVRELRDGRIVVVNGSRRMIAAALDRFADSRVILVDAPRALRAQRLSERGRETDADIALRLDREITVSLADAIHIDNSGSAAAGAERFVAVLRDLAAE